MLYTVSIDYKEFTFNDPTEAIQFAKMAMLHQTTEMYKITIEIKKEPKDASYIDNES